MNVAKPLEVCLFLSLFFSFIDKGDTFPLIIPFVHLGTNYKLINKILLKVNYKHKGFFIINIDFILFLAYNISVDGRLFYCKEKGRLLPSLFAFGNNERLLYYLITAFYCRH